jgi:hypothetical protein
VSKVELAAAFQRLEAAVFPEGRDSLNFERGDQRQRGCDQGGDLDPHPRGGKHL